MSRLKFSNSRCSHLSLREREVMGADSVRLGQQAGCLDLGITENTAKMHRFNVIRKMRAESFAGLVEMAAKLRILREMVIPAKLSVQPQERVARVAEIGEFEC